eukprot:CAMPEP_0194154114 /NCGR_PEP_ID=MMETSP0152-20130528/59240_1 /TAXON_ID=1049557 /ORGANISM="Thalassiothrix antarctica, Strain L6-D1" /LENGTH=242 /DNA_ID=CAMNT_0038859927 /DNA_START=404 /DNA_END=1132 /DNA_ORIENTATION=+
MEAKRDRVRKALNKRHQGMLKSSFIDTDAIVDKNGSIETDEDEDSFVLQKIDNEEEAAAHDFINDSQLDYTQDVLGKVDPSIESKTLYRMVDIEKERDKQFSTPILNRRMLREKDNQEGNAWVNSPSNTANQSSLRGLGNCHFIRSVIEHARKGGDVEDIEAVYHSTLVNMTPESANLSLPETSQLQPFVFDYESSSNEEVKVSPEIKTVLTNEQQAVIEKRRLDALARRKTFLSQQHILNP